MRKQKFYEKIVYPICNFGLAHPRWFFLIAFVAVVLCVVALAGCYDEPTNSQRSYQAAVAEAAESGAKALAATIAAMDAVDSNRTNIELLGIVAKRGLPVAPLGYGYVHLHTELPNCGEPPVDHWWHFEADLVTDLPEVMILANPAEIVALKTWVAGISANGVRGVFSLPYEMGAEPMARDDVVVGPGCPETAKTGVYYRDQPR